MFKEIERVQRELDLKYEQLSQDEKDEWRLHPTTKAFEAELKSKFLNSLTTISDIPLNEQTRLEQASAFGQRDFIVMLLDSVYFNGEEDEE